MMDYVFCVVDHPSHQLDVCIIVEVLYNDEQYIFYFSNQIKYVKWFFFFYNKIRKKKFNKMHWVSSLCSCSPIIILTLIPSFTKSILMFTWLRRNSKNRVWILSYMQTIISERIVSIIELDYQRSWLRKANSW